MHACELNGVSFRALAKAGLRVLHLDPKPTYGSFDHSCNLNEVHKLLSTSPLQAAVPPRLQSVQRQFNLAYRPTLIPALSPFVDTLIQSGASNYSGFRLLESVALLHSTAESTLQSIPMSKEAIFNSPDLSLVQKRRIMKFLQFAVSFNSEQPGEAGASFFVCS